MKNIQQNWSVKRFILLFSFVLTAVLAIGCGQSSSGNYTLPTPAPTPAPPENFFPAKLGDLNLSVPAKYVAEASKNCACQHFEAVYSNGKIGGGYAVEIYKSADEARQGFNAKKYLEQSAEVTKQSETELVAIKKMNGNVMSVRPAGANLIIVSGRKDAAVIIENNLPYQTLGIAKPAPRKIEEFLETPVLASVVQKDFETNQADAAKKYGVNFVLLKGNVKEFGDNVETQTIKPKTTPSKTPAPSPTSSRRPRNESKYSRMRRTLDRIEDAFKTTPKPTATPTPRKVEVHHPFVVLVLAVKGGEPIEILCDFDKGEVEKVMKLKEGQEILFRGKITFVEGKIKISDARIDDFKYEGVK